MRKEKEEQTNEKKNSFFGFFFVHVDKNKLKINFITMFYCGNTQKLFPLYIQRKSLLL